MKITKITQPNILNKTAQAQVPQNFKLSNFMTSPLSNDIFVKTSSVDNLSFGKSAEKKLKLNHSIYKDSEKFGAYFNERLKNELLLKTEDDVEEIIKNLQEKTGADEQTVREVVARVSSFSSYSQIREIGNAFLKADKPREITLYDNRILHTDNDFAGICSDSALRYVGAKKNQIDNCNNESLFWSEKLISKEIFLADDYSLYWLDKLKHTKPDMFKKIKNDLKHRRVEICAVDGWNVKSDGKYYSFGMFGKNIELDELAQKVIEKMQNENLTVDEALNGDFIEDVKKVLGEKTKVSIIKNAHFEGTSTKDITKMLSPVAPDGALFNKAVDATIGFVGDELSEEQKQDSKKMIRKYFDEMICPQSSESLTREVKDIYNRIKQVVEDNGGTMDDVYYLIPMRDKSYDLVNYQYQKTNNIHPERIIHFSNWSDKSKIKCLDSFNKFFVVLDDMTGTGSSLISQGFDYEDFLKLYANDGARVIFAPLISLKDGEDCIIQEIKNKKREGKDFFVTNKVYNYEEFLEGLDEAQKDDFREVLGGDGHMSGGSALMFPYGTPDNNSDLASAFGTMFLLNIQPAVKQIYDEDHKTLASWISEQKDGDKE